MPFRSNLSHTKPAMTPVHPEDKCAGRKRRRPSTTTTTTSPMHPLEEEDLLDAALFDCDFSDVDLDDAIKTQNHLKRLCVHADEAFDDCEELQLSEEVQTLKASVHSMAATVAEAAHKINELRELISLLVDQQQPETSN